MEVMQDALLLMTASAAQVSVFAAASTITNLLTNARTLVSRSYIEVDNQQRLLNEALDILRGIDKSKLEDLLLGDYNMLIDLIKSINPPYSPDNAIFIDPPISRDESGEAKAKRIKTEL